VTATASVRLVLGGGTPEAVARRIDYAFRLYCTLAGVAPADDGVQATVDLRYGGSHAADAPGLPATYRLRPATQAAAAPSWVGDPAGDGTVPPIPCFHPVGPNGAPDLLGELFEWVSADHERSIRARDDVGRIPFADTLHGRYGIDPTVPWANRIVVALHRRIGRSGGAVWPALRPLFERATFAATHDLDFLPGRWPQTAVRWGKNLTRAVSARDVRLASQIGRSGLRALRGDHPLSQLQRMVEREAASGIRSSVNVICDHAHRRDANYRLEEPRTHHALEWLCGAGVELGVHGSYTSLATPGRLAQEFDHLRRLGYRPIGGRQHWLRYDGAVLFEELERAGAAYDSTAGYSDRPGFRQGLAAPFAPWDFTRERPFPLLELPLAVMDVSLADRSEPETEAAAVVAAAAQEGSGGVALLWHDTVFGGSQVDEAVARVYWTLKQPDHDWLRPVDVVAHVWSRFEGCGLLPAQPEEITACTMP